MRRIVGLLVLAPLLGLAATAAAHPGAITGTVPVGEDATISINVPSEQSTAMVGVDVEVPAAYELSHASAARGWRTTTTGATVRFTGTAVPPGQAAVFSLSGRARQEGVLAFVVVTHQADGSTFRWDGEPGTERPAVEVNAGGAETGEPASPAWRRPRTLAGALLAGLGVGLVMWLVVGRRRPGTGDSRS